MTPSSATPFAGGGRRSGFGTKQNWDSYLVKGKIRRLTPVECERLQGFPDRWTETGIEIPDPPEYYKGEHEILSREVKISDSQRYKTLGNAVTVNVINKIMQKIYADI